MTSRDEKLGARVLGQSLEEVPQTSIPRYLRVSNVGYAALFIDVPNYINVAGPGRRYEPAGIFPTPDTGLNETVI